MGLGKTSITLTALQDLLFDRFEAHKVLIIAPLRVARNTWPAELQKWDHLQDLTVSVVVGNVYGDSLRRVPIIFLLFFRSNGELLSWDY